MIPSKNRIGKSNFEKIIQSSHLLASPHFSVRISKISSSTDPHVAVVVSKKISTKAVTRNFIKRRVRSILEEILDILDPHVRLIVFPKKESDTLPFISLKKELRNLIQPCCLS